MNNKALTLIELLVVLAIVAMLAAVALPNFLEAQTRAKVSSAKSNLRTISTGIEAYRIDNNGYPPARGVLPDDPFGILADYQLAPLTNPIAYIGKDAFRDPFGAVRSRSLLVLAASASADHGRDSDFPFPELPNPNRSFLYFHYPSFSALTNNPAINVQGAATISLGPDRQDSFGAFAPFGVSAMPPLAPRAGIYHPVDTLYDPTNGTTSEGDIPCFSGQPARSDLP